jgi:hypothetical protein
MIRRVRHPGRVKEEHHYVVAVNVPRRGSVYLGKHASREDAEEQQETARVWLYRFGFLTRLQHGTFRRVGRVRTLARTNWAGCPPCPWRLALWLRKRGWTVDPVEPAPIEIAVAERKRVLAAEEKYADVVRFAARVAELDFRLTRLEKCETTPSEQDIFIL